MGSILGIGKMTEAASNLRQAGEAFERFGKITERLGETIAFSMAQMSSEFDPFGYKTGFRALSQQAEMLEKQQATIQALQQREIDRLNRENERLRQEVKQKRRGRNRKRRKGND